MLLLAFRWHPSHCVLTKMTEREGKTEGQKDRQRVYSLSNNSLNVSVSFTFFAIGLGQKHHTQLTFYFAEINQVLIKADLSSEAEPHDSHVKILL